LFTLRGGTGTGGETHRGPHAQEQLRANVQPARSQGYQQQRRVSAMRTIVPTQEVWFVSGCEEGYLFETKRDAEIHAKNIFPDEPEPTRYARIYFKTVYEFKEV
jgi:hypothetical protein